MAEGGGRGSEGHFMLRCKGRTSTSEWIPEFPKEAVSSSCPIQVVMEDESRRRRGSGTGSRWQAKEVRGCSGMF